MPRGSYVRRRTEIYFTFFEVCYVRKVYYKKCIRIAYVNEGLFIGRERK